MSKFHKLVERHYSGEVENVYIILEQLIQETVYQILPQLPQFYRRYYKNILVPFFLDIVYIRLIVFNKATYLMNDHIPNLSLTLAITLN